MGVLEQAAGRDRDQQGRSNLVSNGGEGSLSCAWSLDTCRRAPQRCAPLVLSEPSQVDHPDLEPLETEPVKIIEIMRRSPRMSHHLRSKRARTLAIREPNAAGTRCGARQAVTSAVRGGGAHVLEPFSHVVGWYNSRPSRSSTARLVALDPPFGGLSSPGGSHSGSQPNTAPATAPVRSPRHPRVPWLHAPRSPGAPPHAKARPTCSKSISPRGCRTLRSRRPRRACSSRSTSRPSSRRPRAAA